MEAKHTPGPWYSGPWIDRKKAIADSPKIQEGKLSAGTNLIATIWPISSGNHHEANASLIVAAPDLLAALENLLRPIKEGWKVDDMDVRIKEAQEAITKAKAGA